MSVANNKKILKTEVSRDGKQVKLAVVKPNYRQVMDGQKVHNRAYREALESKGILREKVRQYLKEQKLWDDEKQKDVERLQKTVVDGEKKLKRGGIKLSEAKTIALDMRRARLEIADLTAPQLSIDSNTVEAQAENMRFNYFVSVCTVYEDIGKPYFSSLEDYLARATEDAAFEAASTLATLITDFDEGYQAKLPENSFLLKYKFVDSKLRLINERGHLVDVNGRLIDEDGRYVAYVGNDGEPKEKIFVDRDGNRLDDKGDYVFEDASPFLDDDGQPIEVLVQQEEASVKT